MISAKRLDVLCLIDKESFSPPLINTKRLQRKTLSKLWQEIMRCTCIFLQIQVRQLEQEDDARFSQKEGTVISIFRKQIKLLRMSEISW